MRIILSSAHTFSLLNLRGDLAKDIIDRGHTLFACGPESDPELVEKIESLGAKFQKLETDRTGTSPLQDIKYLYKNIKLYRELKPDAVITFNIKTVVFGSIAAQICGIKKIHSIIPGLGYAFSQRYSLKDKSISAITNLLYKFSIRKHHSIVFQNEDDMAQMKSMGMIKHHTKTTRVYGSGVCLKRYPRIPIPNGPIKFLMIARLLLDKGVIEYCKAAEQIKSKYPLVEFHLVGPHDKNPRAVDPEQLAQWEKNGTITYHGGTQDVRPYHKMSSVFVLPSYYREGCPRSAIEALSTGRPIITTDSIGCRDTVEHNVNGYLVSPRSVTELAKAMESLIKEPQLLNIMGARSRTLAEKRFDVRKINKQMIEAFELSSSPKN